MHRYSKKKSSIKYPVKSGTYSFLLPNLLKKIGYLLIFVTQFTQKIRVPTQCFNQFTQKIRVSFVKSLISALFFWSNNLPFCREFQGGHFGTFPRSADSNLTKA
jgi:hypothetical protein